MSKNLTYDQKLDLEHFANSLMAFIQLLENQKAENEDVIFRSYIEILISDCYKLQNKVTKSLAQNKYLLA